jgi:hypothetical protein
MVNGQLSALKLTMIFSQVLRHNVPKTITNRGFETVAAITAEDCCRDTRCHMATPKSLDEAGKSGPTCTQDTLQVQVYNVVWKE